MTSRRVPLSNLPHATNSPLRHTGVKRTRAETQAPFDELHAPPSKRQLIDSERRVHDRENVPPQPLTPQKKKAVSTIDARLAKYAAQPALIEKERLLRHALPKERVRDTLAEASRRDRQKVIESRLDDVTRWQRYYEKKFPEFVFYFDNVPEDARRQCLRQVRELGASEEKFFSRAVTHVITTRSKPSVGSGSTDEHQTIQAEDTAHHNGTINPSLLDRRNKAIDELAGSARTRYNLDSALSRKTGQHLSADNSMGKASTARGDILLKAEELGIKVWQLEKLQRMLKIMYADNEVAEVNEQDSHRIGKTSKQANLSQLIKNEERSQVGHRELDPMLTELILLNEPYIFVRDMNEKTKPLMVRQYTKVAKPEDGEWPQFRPVTQGKCPFIIEEPRRRNDRAEANARREAKAEQRLTRTRAQAQAEAEAHAQAQAQSAVQLQHKRVPKRTRAEMSVDQSRGLTPYEGIEQRQPLIDAVQELARRDRARRSVEVHQGDHDEDDNGDKEAQHDGNYVVEDATTDATQITPPTTTETLAFKTRTEDTCHTSHSRQTSIDLMAPPAALPLPNPHVGAPGGEPLASGMQKSGMTSAIRSQMGISSTAAGPGTKAGTSRDIHSLQRRVLERKSTGSGSALGTSGAAMATGSAAAANNATANSNLTNARAFLDAASRTRPENPRAAKIKAVEKIVHGRIQDFGGVGEKESVAHKRKAGEPDPSRPKFKKEPKPGYCENCREKFDDFELHTESRKHRKFAQTKENWAELDVLLSQLQRPVKDKKRKRHEYEHV